MPRLAAALRHLARLTLLALGVAVLPLARAAAQRPTRIPTVRPMRQPQTPARDTTRRARGAPGVRDTTKADSTQKELVEWAEPDSVMQALMARQGYVVTRYQGDTVRFDAKRSELHLQGKAAIEREQSILVSDSLVYNDSTKLVDARGDTIVLRDPAQGPADVVAQGRLVYNISTRSALVSSLCTQVETDQRWFVCGQQSGFRTEEVKDGVKVDSAGVTVPEVETRRIFFARNGTLTSCDLPQPHYHFQAKEMKVISRNIMVARPAVLYIEDIPILWLPFVFQDMRSGRRSGILSPRLGFSDIIRQTPTYRRQIENVGYYFALSDYMDALIALDWRSGARKREGDPGWMRWNAEWNYKWLDRFLGGHVGFTYDQQNDGRRTTNVSWQHTQDFSLQTHLRSNFNYVSNTEVQHRQSFNIAQALAAITSQADFQSQLGPASFSLGGTRTQYSGRKQVDQNFPNFSISTKPVNAGSWLVWSPTLSVTNQQSFNIDAGGGGVLDFRFFLRPDGSLDSTRVRRDTRTSTATIGTPLRIFGFNWSNSFNIQDLENDFPQTFTIVDVNDSSKKSVRTFARTFRTDVDWSTGIELPPISQGKWNLVPRVSIVNSAPGAFLVRNERTGGSYVSQGKRLEYGISATPTIFGFIPGFGPFARLRHSISPSLNYSFAPKGNVSDEYLRALGYTRQGFVGNLTQNRVSLGLRQVLEAKIKGAPGDTAADAGQKIKLLDLGFSTLDYDFELAKLRHGNGLATSSFRYDVRSDLLPGFDFSVDYSLFEGDPRVSDTARFKPFRTGVQASLSIGRERNPFAMLTRVFGRGERANTDTTEALRNQEPGEPSQLVQSAQIAGAASSRVPLGIQNTNGWEAQLSFSSTRQRPPRGNNVLTFDPFAICQQFQSGPNADPILFQQCINQRQQVSADTIAQTAAGGVVFRVPPQTTLRGNFTFNLTPRWALQWGTGYDFERRQFSDHIVTLQRDLHDWRAIFAFTQAPNGNFAFNFFISLKAEPDLKFDYNRRTYRPTVQ